MEKLGRKWQLFFAKRGESIEIGLEYSQGVSPVHLNLRWAKILNVKKKHKSLLQLSYMYNANAMFGFQETLSYKWSSSFLVIPTNFKPPIPKELWIMHALNCKMFGVRNEYEYDNNIKKVLALNWLLNKKKIFPKSSTLHIPWVFAFSSVEFY